MLPEELSWGDCLIGGAVQFDAKKLLRACVPISKANMDQNKKIQV